jgi:DNA polymerase I-like protein with 3'-5' exonuclease and polymerase domains
MKRWMYRVWLRMKWVEQHEGWYWEPELQVHDDLKTEFAAEKVKEVERHMTEALGELQWFDIPITAEFTSGQKWSEL